MSDPAERTIVIGVGNTLLGDDGIGVRLVEDLAPAIRRLGADAVYGGTGGFSLIGLVEDRPLVIFVDAVAMGLEPGDAHAFGTEVIEQAGAGGETWSGHEIDLADTIALVERIAPDVRIRVIGIEPADTTPSLTISRTLERRYSLVRRETWKLLKKELQPAEVKA